MNKETNSKSLIPEERIEQTILIIRNQKVILDSDLAALYGVGTKVLNQAIKRNMQRFPENFMFRLTVRENELVTNCDRFKKLKHSSSLPHAFTEHGALMAANVLNSPQAISMSLAIINIFIKLRQMLSVNEDLSRRLDELEAKYDEQFQDVFQAIRRLMETPEEPKKAPMGFIDSGN
jgi:hypothetical protein